MNLAGLFFMSSGILTSDSGPSDYSAALFLADAVGEWWNTNQSKRYGFRVVVSEGKARACCDLGAELFKTGFFPEPPGPFKRVAALVVLGRLYPFFDFCPLEPRGYEFKNGEEKLAWITRMMVLSIPFTFSKLFMKKNETEIPLDEWAGFPSSHYRLEFMGWLRWLDNCEKIKTGWGGDLAEWAAFSKARLARMVMSTSLMLEACYYLSPSLEGTASKLLTSGYSLPSELDEDLRLDLYYDTDAEVRSTPKIKP